MPSRERHSGHNSREIDSKGKIMESSEPTNLHKLSNCFDKDGEVYCNERYIVYLMYFCMQKRRGNFITLNYSGFEYYKKIISKF